MNRTRLIIVLLLVIVIVGVAVALVSVNAPPAQDTSVTADPNQQQVIQQQPDSTALPTITPIPMAEIVIAVQDIPRGVRVDANTIALVPWPADAVPVNAITNTEDVIGLIARTDIYREQPILGNLVVPDFQSLATIGSDAALITPPNRLLVAVPMNRLTSVAYAIQPGDRVDIIASLLFVDVDQTFQSLEPNTFATFIVEEPATPGQLGSISFSGDGLRGAFDSRLLPGVGSVPVLVQPSEEPRPRLSVQRTVQDALVIWVGDFPADGKLFVPAATPTPENPTPTPEGVAAGTEAAPTPIVIVPDIVTLAVSPQDAVVLTWYVEAKIPFTFAVRSAATTTLPQTDAVTLDYIMSRFNILVPEKFNYAIEPAIRSIRRLEAGDEITLQSE
jgi:pilus assembly protein CpaB